MSVKTHSKKIRHQTGVKTNKTNNKSSSLPVKQPAVYGTEIHMSHVSKTTNATSPAATQKDLEKEKHAHIIREVKEIGVLTAIILVFLVISALLWK